MQVFVTERAVNHFDSIVTHIKKNWGEKTVQQFVLKTDKILKLLKNYPTIGPIEKGEIRSFQLSRQTKMLYRIKDQRIIIIAFFDVRQHPDKKMI